MKQWYEKLFENYSKSYDKEIFTQNTLQEVDFLESEINSNKSVKILDIGCGTGRHAIELTKRGYNVTGFDLSEAQITRAKEKATQENVNIDFHVKDARKPHFKNEFDLIIMLCEGGFPLMETDEMNFQILENATRALKNGGKIIFTTLNGLYPLFHSVKDMINEHAQESSKTDNHTFDLMTFRDHSEFTFTDDDGKASTVKCNERYYVPSEITWMLKSLKYSKIDILGCPMCNYDRNNKLSTEDYEMLVVAEK